MTIGWRDLPHNLAADHCTAGTPNRHVESTETLLVFMRTFRDIYAELESRLAQFGITQGRFMILKIMSCSNEEHLTPSELAERAGVTRGTVSGLIDGLEREGLIERRHHLSDRRMVTVHLTEASKKLMDQLLPYYVKGMDMLMSELTGEDRDDLIKLMGKLNAGLLKVKKHIND